MKLREVGLRGIYPNYIIYYILYLSYYILTTYLRKSTRLPRL